MSECELVHRANTEIEQSVNKASKLFHVVKKGAIRKDLVHTVKGAKWIRCGNTKYINSVLLLCVELHASAVHAIFISRNLLSMLMLRQLNGVCFRKTTKTLGIIIFGILHWMRLEKCVRVCVCVHVSFFIVISVPETVRCTMNASNESGYKVTPRKIRMRHCCMQPTKRTATGIERKKRMHTKKIEHYCFQQYPNNIWVFTSVHVVSRTQILATLFFLLFCISLLCFWCGKCFFLIFNCSQLCKIVGFLCAEFVLQQMLCSAFFYQCN